VKRTGLAQYSWLSNSIAWADSITYEDWNIRQGGQLPELSFNHDSNEARDEYGAFRLADYGVAASYNGVRPPDFIAPQVSQDRQSLTSAVIPLR
jgi:hypothetical protein